MASTLQIVSFDIPFPADYGGAIDVFYKIKALKEMGVSIDLHCFKKDRKPAAILEELCDSVSYYKRKNPLLSLGNARPHIVASRKSDKLLNKLSNSDSPILFEGLHSCYYLNHPALDSHMKVVRMHNIEWQYYEGLGKQSEGLKKIYFDMEAGRLKTYEKELVGADLILGITEKDRDYYREIHPKVEWLPCFHPTNKLSIKKGKGSYLLYHGNLSVPENEQAAKAICHRIAGATDFPIVIAGKNPSPTLIALAEQKNVKIVANPEEAEMQKIIQEAQMHLLWTEQDTGVKLKLIYALCGGRHVLANDAMTKGTKLSKLTHSINSTSECLIKINELHDVEISDAEIKERRSVLNEYYQNSKNAAQLMDLCNDAGVF